MRGTLRLVPGMPDLVFGIMLAVGLVGGRHAFLNDPGTFWHLELGRRIAETGELPRVDSLSYTHDGGTWIDTYWAFDLTLAAVVDRWGWSAAVAATALGLAWIYSALTRWVMDEGASPSAAIVATVVAAAIGAGHFLTRPHLVTMALVLFTLRACRRYHEGREPGAFWGIPAVVAVWSNCHPGFVAGPLIVATAGVGHAISGHWDRPRARRVCAFAAVTALAILAGMANPFGAEVYRHTFDLLYRSGVTRIIQEHQPVQFGEPEALLFEGVVLALVALPSLTGRRLSRYELCHVGAWLHMALKSVRHASLFGFAAAPSLARLVDGLLTEEQSERDWSHRSIWSWVATAAVATAAVAGIPFGGPSATKWPLDAIPTLDRQPTAARLFHEQDWGGLIASECRPPRRVFIDDRFELYRKEGVLAYVAALDGGPGWDELDGRYHFDLVWLRPSRPLARRLEADPGWEVVRRDGVSILLRRVR